MEDKKGWRVDFKKISVIATILFYFGMSWFFPWGDLEVHQSISSSYFFDLLFFAIVAFSLKEKVKTKLIYPEKLFLKCILISFTAIVIIMINQKLSLNAPFKYLDKLVIQILFLAPVIEELVFRFSILNLLKRLNINLKWQIFVNSFLFAVSHIQALWILPKDFQGFILYQVGYTFLLGWICTKAMIMHKNILAPIIIHFIFNFIFYLAVINETL